MGSTFVDDQTEESLAQLRLSILNMDPPKHNRDRRLVSRGFTPRVIAQLDETIERRAALIVDRVVDWGECEFVEDVAALLPLQMICEMIGLPEADWPRMFDLSNRLVGFDDPDLWPTAVEEMLRWGTAESTTAWAPTWPGPRFGPSCARWSTGSTTSS